MCLVQPHLFPRTALPHHFWRPGHTSEQDSRLLTLPPTHPLSHQHASPKAFTPPVLSEWEGGKSCGTQFWGTGRSSSVPSLSPLWPSPSRLHSPDLFVQALLIPKASPHLHRSQQGPPGLQTSVTGSIRRQDGLLGEPSVRSMEDKGPSCARLQLCPRQPSPGRASCSSQHASHLHQPPGPQPGGEPRCSRSKPQEQPHHRPYSPKPSLGLFLPG